MLCKWLGVNTFSRPMRGAKPLRVKRCANVASCPVGQLLYLSTSSFLFRHFLAEFQGFDSDQRTQPGLAFLDVLTSDVYLESTWESEIPDSFRPPERLRRVLSCQDMARSSWFSCGRDRRDRREGQNGTKSFMAVRTLDPWFIQLLKGLSRRFQKSIRSKQKCYCIKINQAFCNWNMCGDGSCLTCSKLASADDLSSIKHGKWGWQNHETLGLTGVPSRSK